MFAGEERKRETGVLIDHVGLAKFRSRPGSVRKNPGKIGKDHDNFNARQTTP
jgi:hypothetical protein